MKAPGRILFHVALSLSSCGRKNTQTGSWSVRTRQWQGSHFMNYAWTSSGDCNEPVSHCHSLREESPSLVHGFELLISKPSWEGSGTCRLWDLAGASMSLSLVDELWGLTALPTRCSLSRMPVCGQPASHPCCHAFPGCGRDERCLELWAKANPFFPRVFCSEYFLRATETQLIQWWISDWRFWAKLNHVMSWICERIRGRNTPAWCRFPGEVVRLNDCVCEHTL